MATRQRTATTVVVEDPLKVTLEATSQPQFPDIKTIKDAIPAHCFQPSLLRSYSYVFRDFAVVSTLVWAALTYIPNIPDPTLRVAAWMVYGFIQGLFCTGIWILGHECGHGAFSLHGKINNVTGWFLHSFLMVPYFSWKYSHHRHHRFTGHMDLDMAFVPATQPKPSKSLVIGGVDIAELLEDTPISQLVRLIFHQLFGWQAYTFLNASAGKGSKQWEPQSTFAKWFRVSHFDPFSAVFRPSEAIFVAITDLGLALTLTGLYFASKYVGVSTVLYLYLVPYLWVHNWLVAITYLHHHHTELPHYTAEGWTYVKGALATVDREFGFIGKHIFHGIIEKHVIHHLFPKIPFYYADEATEAIKPVVGDHYCRDDRNFLGQLWTIFGTLKYVEHDPTNPGAMRWAKERRATPRHGGVTQTTSTLQPDRVAVLEERLATIEALFTAFVGQNPTTEPQQNAGLSLVDIDPSSASNSWTTSARTPGEATSSTTNSAQPTTKVSALSQLELAPLSEILPVVDNYFRNYNAIIPLFDETAFMRMLLEWFSSSTKRSMISWAAINVVLALSYRIVEGRLVDDPELAQCTRNLRSVMSELMTPGKDLLGLQVLLGMVIMFQGSPDFQLAIVLTGSVVRLAQSLGLHLKQTLTGLSRAEQAHRRRLFWLSYVYDKEMAQRSQSPCLQLDSETNMDLPETDPEDNLGVISSSTDNVHFNYLCMTARLACIQGKAHDLLYSQRSQKLTQEQRTNAIVRIEDTLKEWAREIPAELHTAEDIDKRLSPIARDLMMTLWFRHAECRVKVRSIFTLEDAWITRVRRYLTPAVIDVGDEAVVRRENFPPLPPGWDECVEYSRICMELIIKKQPTEYMLWLHTCGAFSCLILLVLNMIEYPDRDFVVQDRKLLDGCFGTFEVLTNHLPKEPYGTILSVARQLDQKAKGQVSRFMLDKGDVADEVDDFQMSPSMAWAILDDMDFQ
ncbi:omega-6 fatty acid desaturase (delta-12 desaturase) [Fusarium heterosporum]|uniref:Omega-6 fatty acid desaturase (Delta-12 desaturase) n=1 Tax=Fusarium heterosporum TaxID=42747 RepID=A0A8H5TW90_FUSHE|nr:omega-6 fatty acid desaturase (delta-12 desaturase) [Fusarium heterosporum]